MKRFLYILCWTFVVPLNAQTFDDMVAANPRIDCWDVTHNVLPIVGRLYSRGAIDSLYMFVDYWEARCRPTEATFRLRNILDIRLGKFHSDSIGREWIGFLMNYKHNVSVPRDGPYFPGAEDFLAWNAAYDSLTQRIASETLASSTDAALILDFYSQPIPTFENIRMVTEPSRLKSLYNEVYSRIARQPLFQIGFNTGAIHNFGNISVFGTRPNFGLSMGAKLFRHNFDLILDFRAGPSQGPYSFVYEDSLITHRQWTGMYVGFEYTFNFVETDRLSIGVSPGLGLDRITALTVDNDYGEEAGFLPGFNKNAGLVFKHKLGTQGRYVGLHLRYNWIRYDNPGGQPLDGGYLSARVTIGFVSEWWRETRLRALE